LIERSWCDDEQCIILLTVLVWKYHRLALAAAAGAFAAVKERAIQSWWMWMFCNDIRFAAGADGVAAVVGIDDDGGLERKVR